MKKNRRHRTRRRRIRRKSWLIRAWIAVHHAFQKGWVRALASLGMLTIWLKVTAQNFDSSEVRTLGLQAMSVLVISVLGLKEKR